MILKFSLNKEKLHKFFVYLAFISLIFQIVNGLWLQISMFLFNGKVLFPNVAFKFIFLFGLFGAFLIRRKIIQGKLFKIWLFFVLYLLFETVYFYFIRNYRLEIILFGFNSYYFYLIVLAFLPSLSGVITQKNLIEFLVFLFIPISIIAILQHFTNTSILPVKSTDGYFEVQVYNFYNHIRAFSLFGVSLQFAAYSTFIGLIFLFLFFKNNNKLEKLLFLLLFFLSLYFVYISYTRTGYLLAFFGILSFLLIEFFKKEENFKNYLENLPIFYFFIGIFLILFLAVTNYSKVNKELLKNYESNISKTYQQILATSFKNAKFKEYKALSNFEHSFKDNIPVSNTPVFNAPVLSADSFFMRLINWKIFPKMSFKNLPVFLFGFGVYQNARFNELQDFCIDNLYIALFIHIGFLGLILSLILLYWFYKFLFLSIKVIDISKVFAAFYSSFTLTAFFAGMIPVYLSICILLFFILPKELAYDLQKIYENYFS